ncbi:hypothetical protein IEQ34_009222 [Dendrobium chrysotoxum]|uniref:Fe2OG dioxygenase domain-containing protein n=1 Tax=Dendrobium chrysotoxum TaxID=161865 RepID=A0AAV7GZZ8_DENCH|nr:hypothetical protein IEQ34_009222 [Dendrobium chrysotoxum]
MLVAEVEREFASLKIHSKMSSTERYDYISWVDLFKKQEIEKKRKKNTQDFVMEEKVESNPKKAKLYMEKTKQRVFISFSMKKDYACLERINRRLVNILDGLELHIGIFNSMEQKKNYGSIHTLNKKKDVWQRICDNTIRICIINIYEPGDCIPPHIDNYNFVRPFSTMSFLSECNIIFGHKLKSVKPGEFIGSALIPLLVGYVLVLNGNRVDLAKHCIPTVSCKRISITFRKMDKAKRPHNFKLDSDLQNIKSSDLSDSSESYHTYKRKHL